MNEEQNINEPQNPAFLVGAVSGSFFSLIFSTLENKLKISLKI
jgi:hypothetical protein